MLAALLMGKAVELTRERASETVSERDVILRGVS